MTDIIPAAEPQNPMQMLAGALQRGVNPEHLKALMDLAERHEANEARRAYVVAMNAFKADAPKIIKTREVSFGTGKTAYKHAVLGIASEQIAEALTKHGISHRWDVEQPEGGRIRVSCILTHAMGHSERVTMEATPDTSGSKNSIQAIGSTVYYLQRYTLFAATGLAPKDADDDAAGGKPTQAMDERRKNELLEGIAATRDRKQAESLWQTIATEAVMAADYNELKAAMSQHMKAIEAAA